MDLVQIKLVSFGNDKPAKILNFASHSDRKMTFTKYLVYLGSDSLLQESKPRDPSTVIWGVMLWQFKFNYFRVYTNVCAGQPHNIP